MIFAATLLVSSADTCFATSAGLNLPSYMDVIVGEQPALSSEQVGDQNLLALDLAMFGIYDDALAKFQANFTMKRPMPPGDITSGRPSE